MAIPTSNISMTGIATELGISTSNISLDSLGDKMIVIDPGSSRQTFTLTDTVTLTTDDTSVAANMNTGSGSTQMSEFGGYTKADPIQFSSTSSTRTSQVETISHHNTASNGGCFIGVQQSAEIYAKRVGNDLVWYVGRGGVFSSTYQHFKEGTTVLSDTECARLAGVGSNTSTTVSVAYSTLETSGQVTVNAAAYSSGSTSNNLTSTNTKCGFDFRMTGVGECLPNGTDVVYRYQVDYTVTHPSHVARKFRFFVALKGRYTTTRANCC